MDTRSGLSKRFTLVFALAASVSVLFISMMWATATAGSSSGGLMEEAWSVAMPMLVLSAVLVSLAEVMRRRLVRSDGSDDSSCVESTSSLPLTNHAYSDLFNSTHEAICIHDAETGAMVDVNDRMLEMFRCTREEALSPSLDLIMSGEGEFTSERAVEVIQKARDEGPQVFEWRARRGDGEHFWADVALRCTTIDGQERVIAAVWDISVRKRIEEVLRVLSEIRGASTAGALLDTMTRRLADLLGARVVFVAERTNTGASRMQTLSVTVGDNIEANFEYDIVDTPCEDIFEQECVSFSSNLMMRFPAVPIIGDQGIESYVGHALFDQANQPSGVVVALFDRPIADSEFAESVLKLFAIRFGHELDRKRVDDALRSSESDLRRAQAMAHVGNYFWDIRNNQLTWSDELRNIMGLPDAEPSLDRFLSIVHPDDLQRVTELGQHCVVQGSAFDAEYRIIRPDGSVRHVHDMANVSHDADGNPRTMFGTTHDITDRVLSGIALQESEERYRLVFNQQFQFMAILSPDGVVVDINELPLRANNVTRADYVGRPFWDAPAWKGLDGWPDIIRSRIETAIRDDKPLLVEDQYMLDDGTMGFALACYSVIRGEDDAIRYISVQATDITERKRAEEKLQMHAETQRLLLRELDHRVRNNLSSLVTLIEMSRHSAVSIDDLASSMRSRAQAIASVHAVLSDVNWHAGDIKRLIKAVARPVHRTTMHIDGPLTPIPRTQAQALGLVINELTSNSIKHGAMSVIDGVVDIHWESESDDAGVHRVTLHWIESGLPPIQEPERTGTGTSLIHGLVESELRGEATLTYPPTGVHHTIVMTLSAAATAQFDQPAIGSAQ